MAGLNASALSTFPELGKFVTRQKNLHDLAISFLKKFTLGCIFCKYHHNASLARENGDAMKAKTPNAVDAYVGERVRLRRKLLGLTQVSLSESLGITFQQLQKYEKGVNRIGASRLQRIAEVLGVPIGFFFNDEKPQTAGLRLSADTDEVANFIASKEGLALTRAFIAIENPNIRRKLLALARSLGSTQSVTDEHEGWDRADETRG